MATPWLSVIVPTYNGERFLASALGSVVAQYDDQIEVIAVDDGSTDTTIDILRAFQDRLPMQICTPPRSGNWTVNTNLGLSQARAPYVSMLHQDDLWLPGRLVRVRQAIEEGGNPELLLHDARFIDSSGAPAGVWRCPLPPDRNMGSHRVLEKLLVQNFVAVPAATFKRDAAVHAGGLDEDLWYTADWDLWLKIAGTGLVRYSAVTRSAYRIHSKAQTAVRSADSDGFRNQLELVLERHLPVWRRLKVPEKVADRVVSAARFSIDVNVALASLSHGGNGELGELAGHLLALGPEGLHRYLRDSRISERLGSRIRAKLRPAS